MKGEEVADIIGEKHQHGYGYTRIRCYNTKFHKNDDRDPSLVIYDGDRGYYCFACGVSGSHEWLMKQYGLEAAYKPRGGTIAPKEYKQYDFDNIYTKLDYLPEEAQIAMQAKGLDWRDLQYKYGWMWHTNQIPGWGEGIFIPYKDNGKIIGARLRMLDGPVRFKSLPGGESFPFMIDKAYGSFYVCEGESDTMTLCSMGVKAVGIPGATNMQAIKKLIQRAKDNMVKAHLIVVPDNDKAGSDFAARIGKQCKENGVSMSILKVPHGKDVNEWYNLVGRVEFTEQILEKHQVKVI